MARALSLYVPPSFGVGGSTNMDATWKSPLADFQRVRSGTASYFHFAPILLAPGSIIEPGNFGRIIRLRGAAHDLYRREMAYEAVRQQHFPGRPSRLDCLFCFPTKEEAELCLLHIKGYAESILYEVKSNESSPHIADMNNALQNFALPAFDINVIAYYWRGWQRSPELLITGVAGNARRTYKP